MKIEKNRVLKKLYIYKYLYLYRFKIVKKLIKKFKFYIILLIKGI